MKIELAYALSAAGIIFGIYEGIKSLQRARNKDASEDAATLTTVIVKLESISQGVSEIKSDLCSVKSDIRESRERIIKTEESLKQAHKRIDMLEAQLWSEE